MVGERRRRLEGELQQAVDDGLVASLEAEAARLEQDMAAVDAEAVALLAPAGTRRVKPNVDFAMIDLPSNNYGATGSRTPATRPPRFVPN